MFRRTDDFLNDWKYESESTLKVLRNLTDTSLSQRVTPTGRSLGFLAWHITTSLTGMLAQAKLLPAQSKQEMPATAAEIAKVYERDAKRVAEAVKQGWTDSQLDEEVPMYGEQWKKGFILGALIGHQCHHRGQMTVLMRQAGLKVPGVVGPSAEEWAAMGMQPQP